MDGPEPTGEGREAIEVVPGLVVTAGSSWMVVASVAAVLVVDVRGTVFLIVLATSLALGGVTLAVTVVDVLTQVLLVELEAEVILIDLSVVAVGSCRVVTRLGTVGRVVLAQLLACVAATCRRTRALTISGVS